SRRHGRRGRAVDRQRRSERQTGRWPGTRWYAARGRGRRQPAPARRGRARRGAPSFGGLRENDGAPGRLESSRGPRHRAGWIGVIRAGRGMPRSASASETRSAQLEEPVTVVLRAAIGTELHAVEIAQTRGTTQLQGHEAVRSEVRWHDVDRAVLAADDRA